MSYKDLAPSEVNTNNVILNESDPQQKGMGKTFTKLRGGSVPVVSDSYRRVCTCFFSRKVVRRQIKPDGQQYIQIVDEAAHRRCFTRRLPGLSIRAVSEVYQIATFFSFAPTVPYSQRRLDGTDSSFSVQTE